MRIVTLTTVVTILICWNGSLHAEQRSPAPHDNSNSYALDVQVTRTGKIFNVDASYRVPITRCNAYIFITDYENAKDIPGILESKIISRTGNKVQVERLIQERILLIPIEMRSIIEYVELPNQGLDFEQIGGDTKLYKGSWRLTSEGELTQFSYQSVIEPNSLIPNFVIEHFIKNNIQNRFKKMAENVYQYGQVHPSGCR